MRNVRTIMWVAVVLFILSLGAVSAGTYTLPLTWAVGSYTPAHSHTASFDFGTAFSSIDSVSVHWSGQLTSGFIVQYPGSLPRTVEAPFMAYVRKNSSLVGYAISSRVQNPPYPGVRPFDETTLLHMYGTAPSVWTSMLDGKGTILIEMDSFVFIDPPVQVVNPTGSLNYAEIVLVGTPVPEPSALLSGSAILLPLLSTLRRRRSVRA